MDKSDEERQLLDSVQKPSHRHGPLASLRRFKRTLKRRYRSHSADVLVVSHAKSGRTWLATMISYVYIHRYGLPENEAVQLDRLRKRDPRVPNIIFSHDNRKDAAKTPLFTPAELAGKKVVLLVRHPYDIAVSAYFQSSRDGRKGLGPEHADQPLFDYVAHEKLPQVLAFLKRWQDQLDRIGNALVVRYEDFHADAASELTRLIEFIEGEADPAEIEAAVRFTKFEAMRRKEAESYFLSDKLRPGNPGDPRSFKVREGKVGGYRDRFTDRELAELDVPLAKADLSTFGYTPPPNRQAVERSG